ncbi:sigma-70 family RNA polymerase sigma factor [Blastopirellula marina]|uniref:Probable extracytoplasmic function alternative sigma factor n=1 Tax=Blastopirellula marina DSM 3645 TaxID=314230 RepID=A3ZWP2_9BACT|nr:sigma-70 family RNA polymerase sigma factor [Blastopirellula marina]EAQ79016.1 probable extracytoplasmic function alternative sigma factor [Blastopirellula marina DSM 3645]
MNRKTDDMAAEVRVTNGTPGRRDSFVERDEWFRKELDSIQRVLFSFVASLVRDSHLVRDVVQETSLVIWKKRDEFTPGTNFRSWALRIAYYQSLAALKASDRSRLVFRQDLVDQLSEQAGTSEAILTDDMSNRLRSCLHRLTARQREVIELRYHQARSIEFIAENSDRSRTAVGMLLSRARAALLQCMKSGVKQ